MKKILLVDDSPLDRKFVRKAFSLSYPFVHFIEIPDGRKCIDIIKREKPILTILDIRMPGLSGFDVLEKIRQDPDIKNHTVIILSGSDSTDDINKAIENVANDYYVKPRSRTGYRRIAHEIAHRFSIAR